VLLIAVLAMGACFALGTRLNAPEIADLRHRLIKSEASLKDTQERDQAQLKDIQECDRAG
jgi:hypothetical protein